MRKRSVALVVGVLAVVCALLFVFMPENTESPTLPEAMNNQTPSVGALEEIREELVGAWKTTDDEKYTVHFYEDGTVTESYAADTTSIPLADTTGRWLLLNDDTTPTLITTFPEKDPFVYTITAFTGDSLTLRERNAIRDTHLVRIP